MNPLTLAALEQTAQRAAVNSYAPYSKFRVGAAVLTSNGTQFAGCNVENASYGLSMCAERNAIFAAVAAGETKITAVAIYTPTPEPTAPCGACRQVMREFGTDIKIISTCQGPGRIESTLDELFPESFGPDNLGAGRPA